MQQQHSHIHTCCWVSLALTLSQIQNILLAILCGSSMVILLLGVMTRFVMAAQQGRLMWCVLHCSETPADSSLNAAAACQASPSVANPTNPVLPLWQVHPSAHCVSLHETGSHSGPHGTEPRRRTGPAKRLPVSSLAMVCQQPIRPTWTDCGTSRQAADQQHCLAQPPSWDMLSTA